MYVARVFWSIALFAVCAPVFAAEVPIADFARHEEYRSVKISPNGEYLAATAVVNGQVVLELVNMADMRPRALRPREGDDIADYWWVAPDRLMYTEGVHVAGIDRPVSSGELFSIKADGSGAALLFGYRAGADDSHMATLIKKQTADTASGDLITPLRDDPMHALIASYAWNGPGHTSSSLNVHPEVYRIDLRDGKKTLVTTSPLRGARFLADHTGAIRFALGVDADQVRKVWYRDAQGGDWQLLHDENKQHERFTPLMFDRSNDAVYVICDGANGVGGVCRWNAATRKQDLLWSAKDSSAIELVRTFDELDAFAIRTMPGRPAVTLLDKSAPEAALLVEIMKQLPGEDIVFTSASFDGRKAVFLAHADTDPGVFYLYDVDKKKIVELFQSRRWIKPEQMASMEPIALTARDGLALHGYLTRPPGKPAAKQLPTVVLVHGGPYFVHDTWQYEPEVQMLASRGYAVLQVNFRGSGGYGDAFTRAGFREWGGKMQDDITDATHWIVDQGIADASRVCIFGTSYGAYAALEGAVKEPDLYKCAVGNAGIYDLRLMFTRGDVPQSLFGENYLKMVLGEDQSALWERSPMAHLDKLKAAVMLIVGGADTRAPPVQGESLHNALLQRKVEHEWLYERTEGHGFYTEAHAAEMDEKILAFLDRQIGVQKPATAAAQ
ncbi:MAG: S9 family peptidase [Rudaea sp.]|nr:S9 family peptidase [Rudaea sp.]